MRNKTIHVFVNTVEGHYLCLLMGTTCLRGQMIPDLHLRKHKGLKGVFVSV